MSREIAQQLLCESLGPYGRIEFPYVRMGKIDSLHLLGDSELMLLALYWKNRKRWHNVLDIGANLGLHSICMAKCGFHVNAFEPDPEHYPKLCKNLLENKVLNSVQPHNRAVHTEDGTVQFVRVLDNLTGNHILGFKDSYGPRDVIKVPSIDCRKLWPVAQFAKIDCEGNEGVLVKTLTAADMMHLDLVLEVRNPDVAALIYWHFKDLGVPMWSQKIDWQRVQRVEDVPKLNREGSLFVSHRAPWE